MECHQLEHCSQLVSSIKAFLSYCQALIKTDDQGDRGRQQLYQGQISVCNVAVDSVLGVSDNAEHICGLTFPWTVRVQERSCVTTTEWVTTMVSFKEHESLQIPIRSEFCVWIIHWLLGRTRSLVNIWKRSSFDGRLVDGWPLLKDWLLLDG